MTAVVYDAILGAGNTIKQVASADYSPNNTIQAGRASGAVAPSAHFLTDSKPTVRIQSSDLAGVLGIVSPVAGLDVEADVIDIPHRTRAAGSSYAGTLAHSILRGTDALVVPTSVRAAQGDVASMIDLMVHWESDGFTDPVAQVLNQTLAAQDFQAMFGLGPGVLNGTTVGGVIGHTVNFGLTVEPEQTNGAIFPTTHFITETNPTIDLQFRTVAQLNAFTAIAAAMTSLVVYHRKRAPGSKYVANATAEHISFSFADGIQSLQNVTGQGNQPAIPTLRCHGELLTVSTTATIP